MIAWQTYADAVRSLVGCSVRHAGRSRGGGVDCVGVPYAAAVQAGAELEPTPTYSSQPSEQDLIDGLSDFCQPVEDAEIAHIWQVPFVGGARHVVVPLHDIDGGTLCVTAYARRNRVVEFVWRRENVRGWCFKEIAWRQQA